jgi:hypothetical protein
VLDRLEKQQEVGYAKLGRVLTGKAPMFVMFIGLQQMQFELEVVNQQAVLLHTESQFTHVGFFIVLKHHQVMWIKLDELFHANSVPLKNQRPYLNR